MVSRAKRHRRAKQAAAQRAKPKRTRNRERIVSNVHEMLQMARTGLVDATSPDPRRRRPGLMNLFTYGRSVTFAIQTMKDVDPAFEDWWKPYQNKMSADPLMKYFNEARTDVLHEGELGISNYTVVGSTRPIDLGPVMRELSQHEPPNTVSTFFGDQLGGNGWIVQMPDGSKEKVYFQLPESIDIRSGLRLHNPPTEHDGQKITDKSIGNLGRLYLETLTRIVDEFVTRFSE